MTISFSFTNESRAALLRRLIELTNTLSENTSLNLSINLADLIDFDLNVELPGLGGGSGGGGGTPALPETIRSLLTSLLAERVQISTAFDTLTGTLIGVQDDYVSLIESTGNIVFVLLDQIESVVEL